MEFNFICMMHTFRCKARAKIANNTNNLDLVNVTHNHALIVSRKASQKRRAHFEAEKNKQKIAHDIN